MLFNSIPYIIFLTLVCVILYVIPRKFQWLWLLASSAFFYYKLLPEYLILFLLLAILNFYLGIAIERYNTKRNYIFILGICVNILVLAFFKYFGFLESIIAGIKKLSDSDHLLKIILPIGLSFYIFTILSYLIEIKRGTIKAERHLGIFASSLLFFPKIMQGPIERPGNIFPQFKDHKSFDYEMVTEGLKLMLWGYFKKLVVADRLALYVNAVYGNYEHHSGISLLVATFFYSFQIYADFSGYTDIALGSAKIMGFNLTQNFKRPYFATSIKEFWNRWHISFSTWLRDYIFLPLAVILAGRLKKAKYIGIVLEKWIFMAATIITFAICGIWHGEGLNFLVWGLIFGIYLTIANWTLGLKKKLRKKARFSNKSLFHKSFSIAATFTLVTFAWIFFRAENTQSSLSVIKSLFTFAGPFYIGEWQQLLYCIISIGLLLLYEIIKELSMKDSLPKKTSPWFFEQLGYAMLITIILLIGVFDGGQFIYFQF